MAEKSEYRGAEAITRAENLTKIATNPDAWETEYIDEVTGEMWILDYPNPEQQGGGSPRLRRK